jgi:hypothetical protein
VRDGDDDRRALALQHREVLAGGGDRVDDPRVFQLVGGDLRGVEAQPEEADLHRAERLDQVRRRAADRLSRVRVDDVRHDPLEAGFPHPLDQDVVAEVELVIAERRQVQAGGVQRGDHLLAFEHARRDRRREEVARTSTVSEPLPASAAAVIQLADLQKQPSRRPQRPRSAQKSPIRFPVCATPVVKNASDSIELAGTSPSAPGPY